MSFRYTVVTEFLYGEDVEAVRKALADQLADNAIVVDGRYVTGWFKSLSMNDAREWFEATDLGVGFAILTEWGEVWHQPVRRTRAASELDKKPEP